MSRPTLSAENTSPAPLQLTVNAEQAGTRLDKFISSQRAELTRTFVQDLIEQGRVQVGGRPRKANYRVQAGESVTVELPPPEPAGVQAESIPLSIVYEDEVLLVINKPAGMVVHPAAGHAGGTLVNAVLGHAPEIVVGNAERPGVVHRLDRDTSGLILIAKTDAALQSLQQQFASRSVHKTYLALVHGKVTVNRGRIEAPIGRDPNDRKRMAVLNRPTARSAVTEFERVAANDNYSLLKVLPETGRTHQIRVHLTFIKHPVVGDPTYGRRAANSLGLERQFLHAFQIEIKHPVTGETRRWQAPLPPDLESALLHALGPEAVDRVAALAA